MALCPRWLAGRGGHHPLAPSRAFTRPSALPCTLSDSAEMCVHEPRLARCVSGDTRPSASRHPYTHLAEPRSRVTFPTKSWSQTQGRAQLSPVQTAHLQNHELHRELLFEATEVRGGLLDSDRSLVSSGRSPAMPVLPVAAAGVRDREGIRPPQGEPCVKS